MFFSTAILKEFIAEEITTCHIDITSVFRDACYVNTIKCFINCSLSVDAAFRWAPRKVKECDFRFMQTEFALNI